MSDPDVFKSLLKHGAISQDKIPGILDKDSHDFNITKTSAMHKAGILKPEHYKRMAEDPNFVDSSMMANIFSEAPSDHEITKSLIDNKYAHLNVLRGRAITNDLPKESVHALLGKFLERDDAHGTNVLSISHSDKYEPHHVEAIHEKFPDSAQLGHLYAKTKGMKPETYMKLAQRMGKGPAPTAITLAKNPSLHPQAALELSKHENPMVSHALGQNEALPRGIRASIERNSGLDDLDRKLLG